MNKEKSIELILELYQRHGGDDYIGEPVSQIEHMCQSAQLARDEGYPEEVVLAAFFHDIGHLCEHVMDVPQMNGFGVMDHEKLGADFLRSQGFSETIASLVENHVQAKRYLTYRYSDYFDGLSEASKKTLEFQGGRMTQTEAEAFENDPLFELHIKLRRWDEQAKKTSQPLPPLTLFADMMTRQLSR